MELMMTSSFCLRRPLPFAPSSVGSWSPVGMALMLLLLLLTCQVSGVGSACPSDISQQAHACFVDYDREFLNIRSSPERLCCGLDVETLRAFCKSFMDASSCIKPLKKRCPRSKAIEESMKNVRGAEVSLTALCSDDTIIERYAIHQSCITRAGPKTQQCFRRYLNTSGSIQLMTSVDTRHINQFCSGMRGTLDCIQANVRKECDAEAVELVTKLVKPMVRQSNKCNYNIVTKAPVSRQGQPSPSQDGSWQNPGSGGSASALHHPGLLSSALLTMCVVGVAKALFFFSFLPS